MKKAPLGVPSVDKEVDRLKAKKGSSLSPKLRESFGMRNFGPHARNSAWGAIKSQREYRAKVSAMNKWSDSEKLAKKAAGTRSRWGKSIMGKTMGPSDPRRWPAGQANGGQFRPKG